MTTLTPARVAAPTRRASFTLALPFPAWLFVAALGTDLAYAQTADPQWSTMSSWVLLAALVLAVVSLCLRLVVLLSGAGGRSRWIPLAGQSLATLTGVADFVFHVRDGYSAVVPAGPLLSAATVLIIVSTIWAGRRFASRKEA
jgi:uncharacterized membrane protein